ncbi:hypothetical protein J2S21_004323 [Peribacillus cavernae]|nr:hypothetical protein [Peribacillus cavernae]
MSEQKAVNSLISRVEGQELIMERECFLVISLLLSGS